MSFFERCCNCVRYRGQQASRWIYVFSIRPCFFFEFPPEFSRHANPTTQQTQLTNDYKNIITAFGFPTAMPLGTVVTAWWESSHVLIPVGFLSLSWLESLLFITDVFFCFFLRGKTKRSSKTDYYGSHTTAEQHRGITHLSRVMLTLCVHACAPETRYGKSPGVGKNPTTMTSKRKGNEEACRVIAQRLQTA